jgi:hypothetical protein
MIVYGTGTKKLGTKRIPGEKSPHDETKDIEITGIAKYAHVFWVPLFPYAKKVYAYCPSTQFEIDQSLLSQRATDKIRDAKKTMKIPIYLFSGIVLLALFIGYLVYDDHQHDQEFAKNITDVKATDVLVFKNEDRSYSFGKVSTVIGDTIYLNFSNYVYEGVPTEYSVKREKSNVEDFYSDELYYFLKQTIDSMYQAGEIYDLYRQKK